MINKGKTANIICSRAVRGLLSGLWLLIIFSCKTQEVAGPSEVGNPTNGSVMGVVQTESGNIPTGEVWVKLRPANFTREPEETRLDKLTPGLGLTRKDVKLGDDGVYFMDDIVPGHYMIEISGADSTGALIRVVLSGLNDTTFLDTEKLRPTGTIRGTVLLTSLFDPSLAGGSVIQILGLSRMVHPDSSTGVFQVNGLPEENYTLKIRHPLVSISDTTLPGVGVVSTVTTDMDPVLLNPTPATPVVPLVPTGLLHYYSFDEGTGDVLGDLISANHGQILGGPGWSTGRMGGALLFDGVDDEVLIPEINLAGDFSITSWVNLSGDITNNDVILGKKDDGTNLNFASELFRIYCGCDPGGYYDIAIAGHRVYPDVWIHTAVTRSGSNVYLYLNGVLEETGSWTGSFMAEYIGSGNGDGFGSQVQNNAWLEGKIDDLRIYGRSLNPAEVQTLAFESPVSFTVPTGLVHYWPLDEIVDGSVFDQVSWLHGKVEGSPELVAGMAGQAMQFNGLDTWLSLTTSKFGGDFTIASWVQFKGTLNNEDVILGMDHPESNINFHQGRFTFYAGLPDQNNVMQSSRTFETDTWYHFAATRQGDALQLYVNGVQDGSGSWAGEFFFDALAKGSQGRLEGILDEVRIYNRALTQGEVTQLSTP